MFSLIFKGKQEDVIEPPKKIWPTELNPCRAGGAEGGHYISPRWDVHGKVTKACGECIGILERALQKRGIEDARLTALYWFFEPDEHGNDCIYDKFCAKPSIPEKPEWAQEVLDACFPQL